MTNDERAIRRFDICPLFSRICFVIELFVIRILFPHASFQRAGRQARLAKGYEDFKARHAAGCPASSSVLNSNLRDAVVVELLDDALRTWARPVEGPAERHRDHCLWRLRSPRRGPLQRRSPDGSAPPRRRRAFPLAERLVRDVFDAGLELGHSVRTVGRPAAWRRATP